MKKATMLILALVTILSMFSCSIPQENISVDVICDVSKFANISSSELIELLGKPDSVEKTTTNGFAEFPCVYYDYNNAPELGEVSFILINDSVAKLVSYM